MLAVEAAELVEGLVDVLRLVVEVVVAGALDDEEILLIGASAFEELEPIAVGAEAAGDAADDDLQRLGEQLLGEVESVEPVGGPPTGEAQVVRGVGLLAAGVR